MTAAAVAALLASVLMAACGADRPAAHAAATLATLGPAMSAAADAQGSDGWLR